MGKSPGKWIKSVFFGKKASKTNLSKRREIPKSAYEKTLSAPIEEPVSSLAVDPSFTSETALVNIAGENENLEYVDGEVSRPSNEELTLASSKQDGDAQTSTNKGLPYDSDRIHLEQAAIKAQATFRGYLARRAFRTLKGIIRLQAVIRGHLVRRQAVATLYCVYGIVKFQALVRGQMIRHSDISSEVRGKQSLSRRDARLSDPCKANTYSQQEKLLKNAFIHQLLSSSPTAMPLHLQYDPGEPNSAWNWLLRWTVSRVWGPRCEPKKTIDLKQKVETQKVGQRRSGRRKQSANVENLSARPFSESEKLKHKARKPLNQSLKSIQEQPRNEIDKVKHNPKKFSNFASEIPVQKDVNSEKLKRDARKLSNPQVPEFSGDRSKNPSNRPINDLERVVSNSDNEEKSTALPTGDDSVNDLDGYPVSDVQQQLNDNNEDLLDIDRDFNSMEEQTGNENHKISKRRASLPAKHDGLQTEQRGTRVRSYMATTESAKAKVRGHVSPSFGQDVTEEW